MADGGNVEFVEIDGPVVYLRLQGACGSCPSSLTTMTMGIKRRLMEKIPVRAIGCRVLLCCTEPAAWRSVVLAWGGASMLYVRRMGCRCHVACTQNVFAPVSHVAHTATLSSRQSCCRVRAEQAS